jgi:hypothetical protein
MGKEEEYRGEHLERSFGEHIRSYLWLGKTERSTTIILSQEQELPTEEYVLFETGL